MNVFDMGNLKSTTLEAVPTPAATPEPKTKNRKPQRIAVAEKLRFAEQAIIKARQAARKALHNRERIVGRAILAALAASQDDELKAKVAGVIRAHVTSKSDLAEVADLIC